MSDTTREEMRGAFEADYFGDLGDCPARERDGNGYKALLADSAWVIWQAAWTASRQKALREGADYVLDLLVAAGHITREKAFQARDIACTAGVLPPEESAAELARGDGTNE